MVFALYFNWLLHFLSVLDINLCENQGNQLPLSLPATYIEDVEQTRSEGSGGVFWQFGEFGKYEWMSLLLVWTKNYFVGLGVACSMLSMHEALGSVSSIREMNSYTRNIFMLLIF